MPIAHKIELRPTPEQAAYLNQACGARRHCYNQLLAHFSQPGAKWSKAAAYQHYMTVLRVQFPWYNEVSSRVTRNAIDDLDAAFKGFFRRVKAGSKTPGYPQFKKKDVNDSFALREPAKFDVDEQPCVSSDSRPASKCANRCASAARPSRPPVPGCLSSVLC